MNYRIFSRAIYNFPYICPDVLVLNFCLLNTPKGYGLEAGFLKSIPKEWGNLLTLTIGLGFNS